MASKAGDVDTSAEPARSSEEPVAPVVSIVVVTYRCVDAAREFLASLYRATTQIAFEVVVLDNASQDGTVEMISSRFPNVRLVALTENIGFAAGVNRAASETTGEFLLLLNPDTIVHPGTVERIVAFARQQPHYGIYGGRTLDPDGRVNPGSCWGRLTLWSLLCYATMLSTLFKRSRVFDPVSLGRWQRDSVREVDIVTGCLLLLPRRVWDELGGFDTRFFMYGEDADLALRAAARGYRSVITPEAVITHEIGGSSTTRADKLVLLYRSQVELIRKHFGPVRRPVGLALLWLSVGVRRLLAEVSTGEARMVWPQVWRARKNWFAGYAPPTAQPVAPTEET
jgi:N-acetylglucosaminyl-diphospho-decaprenol L-rhamnosyltransferase